MSADFNPQFQRIGEILIHVDKISESQLNEALVQQKNTHEKLGQVLIDMGMVEEDDLITAYSMQLGYRKADNFLLLEADPDVVGIIPEDFARSNSVLAVQKSNKTLTVAMEDPEDIAAIDSIKRLTRLEPDIVVAGPTLLGKAMDQLYGQIQQAGQVEEAIQGITVITGYDDSAEEVDLSPEKASEEDAPIVKLVNLILQEAIKERATDIHIEPQQNKVNVRIRIDGVLQVIMTPPSTSLSGLVTRIKILSKLNIAEKRLPQDGRFSIKTATKDIDVRVSPSLRLPSIFLVRN